MAVLVLGAIVGGGLAGCVSTQDKNARAKLVASRELDSRRPLQVERASEHVRVTDAALVRGRGASAIVVTLRNGAEEALLDVPIAVGVRGRDGRREALNRGRGLHFFQTHVPAIAAGGSATWVFLTRRPVTAGTRAWARAGAGGAEWDGALPRVDATTVAGEQAGRRVRVALANASGIPQYGLQVYALVQRGGRWVAAGKTGVRHLGTNGRATVAVGLAGMAGGRADAERVRVHAMPTIFE